MISKHEVRKLLWKLGIDVTRASESGTARLGKLLRRYEVDLVLDVGANRGQYGSLLREQAGYRGRIVSFEPLSAPFEALAAHARADGRWEAHRVALGDKDGTETIHVAGNSYSSSLLEMLPAHADAAPGSAYVGAETITVRTLDGWFPELHRGEKNVYLKIDTQGFEAHVLRGARASLAQIPTVQLELSLVPLYAGQKLFDEMVALMREQGYRMVSVEPGFADPRTGELLQADGIFRRS